MQRRLSRAALRQRCLLSALLLFALLPPAWATNARPATVEAGYVPALAGR